MMPTLKPAALISGAVAALLVLSGCSSTPEGDAKPDTAGESSTSALLPEAEGKTDYPLTLETPFGDTTLDERPDRIAIVTSATPDTDALLALGGTPVFAPSTIERNSWLDASLTDPIETIWDASPDVELPAEAVAASKPDLIVTLQALDTFDQKAFDQLSAIAPVLYAEVDSLSWQDLTQTLGDTIDLGDRAAEAVADTESVIERTREAHPEFEGKTATHVIAHSEKAGAFYASTPGSNTEQLFNELGFVLPEAAQSVAPGTKISDELMGMIDADFLLISTITEPEFFLDSPLLQSVPAVAEGRAVIDPAEEGTTTNNFAWGLNQQSVLSIPWLIERLAEMGSEALS
ncbi:ABC transporter substrate-binding protein [Leucobacter sp. UCMA 4100]|nr:ABC transporter substrate-binding protein [Leucobacter sp. UCMA 4100]